MIANPEAGLAGGADAGWACAAAQVGVVTCGPGWR